MTEEVVVVATMRPSPEHAQRVREVLTELVGRVHQEQGCLLYALHSAKDGSLVMLERWASNDALRAHAGGEPAAWSNGCSSRACWRASRRSSSCGPSPPATCPSEPSDRPATGVGRRA